MHCFQNSSSWSVYHSDFKERFGLCELSVTLRAYVRALYSISLGRHLQCSPLLSRSVSLCFTTLHFSCSPWALVAPKMNHAQQVQPRCNLWTKARPSSPSGMFDAVCSCCGHSLSSLSGLSFTDAPQLFWDMDLMCTCLNRHYLPLQQIFPLVRSTHASTNVSVNKNRYPKCLLSFNCLRLMLCFKLENVLSS